jgi:maltodextrin utilization protein YvdJ
MNTDRLMRQLEEQKQARSDGMTAIFGAEPTVAAAVAVKEEVEDAPGRRGRPPKADSKSKNRIFRGWLITPETAKKLKIYVNRCQENDIKIDASDVVEAALSAWLEVNKPPTE